MNRERKKIEYVTKVVSYSGGFLAMLLGIFIAALAVLGYLSDLGMQRQNYRSKDLTFGLTFLIFFALFWLLVFPKIRAHLQKKYGQVKNQSYSWDKGWREMLYMSPYLLAFLGGVRIDVHYGLPFSVTVLLTAVFVFGFWIANQRGVSSFLLWLAGVCLILSFLPWENIYLSVTVLDNNSARTAFYQFVCSALFGVIYFIIGVFDYHLMTTTLKPIARNDEEKIYESV